MCINIYGYVYEHLADSFPGDAQDVSRRGQF